PDAPGSLDPERRMPLAHVAPSAGIAVPALAEIRCGRGFERGDASGRLSHQHEHGAGGAMHRPAMRAEASECERLAVADVFVEAEMDRDRTHAKAVKQRGGSAAPVAAVE